MFSQILRAIGLQNVAAATGRSLRQVYKWEAQNTLPRTEFSGETSYAKKIADASSGLYKQEDILNAALAGRQIINEGMDNPTNPKGR